MSITINSAPPLATIPAVSESERAERLIEAGTFWGKRIAGDHSTAALTYTVTGEGQGSVGPDSAQASIFSTLMNQPVLRVTTSQLAQLKLP